MRKTSLIHRRKYFRRVRRRLWGFRHEWRKPPRWLIY